MKTLLSISTYLKNPALEVITQSLLKNGYLSADIGLHISDDADGNAEEVFNNLLVLAPARIGYSTGPRQGIAKNKNRGIKYFLEKTDAKYLILLDDDIVFINKGIVEEFIKASENSNWHHISTFLGEYGCNIHDSTAGYFSTFPIIAEDENLYWCGGVQGMCCFFTREIIEKVGYFNKFPYYYGYEHAEFSARCNKVSGYCPELFAVLKRSPKFFKTQQIPNNYEVDHNQLDLKVGGKQAKAYKEYLELIYKGYNLNNPEHGLTSKKERLI